MDVLTTASDSMCGGELGPWGDSGQAAVMAFAYRDPRSGEPVTVEQAARVPHAAEWTPRRGPAEIPCWVVLRGGLLQHPVFVGWRRQGDSVRTTRATRLRG